MKIILVFSTIIVSTLAATIAETKYVPITTYHNALTESTTLGPRIANGHVADFNQFPYQVSIIIESSYICGGSIISGDWVLTACHCTVDFKQFNLRFGSLDLYSGGTSLTSFTAIQHPYFNPITLNNDVALIKLPRALGFGPSIQSIRLPRASQRDTTFVDVRSTVSGFGAIRSGFFEDVSLILRYVDMRIIANLECENLYGSNVVLSHVVCALGWTNPTNQGHCGGDSGGPLVIEEGNDKTLIGVVSFASRGGCDRGYPLGYMRTGHFVDWIRQHTKIVIRP